ncbi:hypothetical protein QJQ45_010630 [Haematococcus lacustris]|nr:hypothetical protein QJQ45_010630 [Haematococcus lacustris]
MEKASAGGVSKGQQLPGLQGLPAELLDAVLRQLDASSRLPVFRASKLLATALLRVVPRIQLAYPTQHDIQLDNLLELAPFLTEVLRNRQQPKLHLTLRPASSLMGAMWERHRSEPAAAVSSADAIRMIACMLGAVPLCGAVDCLAISWHKGVHFPWEPESSAALVSSFPSLTSLHLKNVRISLGHLATVAAARLLHLDLRGASIIHEGQVGRSPFIGSRLQRLNLCVWVGVDGTHKYLYRLLPFPSTLTQLEVTDMDDLDHRQWSTLARAVSSLTQLQQLRLSCGDSAPNATRLLQALAHLPSLHTLVLGYHVVGHRQLDALLALTQITRLEVFEYTRLSSSRASAACSWRQLKVWQLDWVTAAHLPLHSLTHPLCLQQLGADVDELTIEVLAAAELNLCEHNEAGLALNVSLCLSKATVDLLTEQYLSRSHTAHHLSHPTVASSSHSGPSTSLASSNHSGPSTSLASSSHSGPSTSLASSSHSGPSTSLASSSHSGPSTSLSSSNHSGPSTSLASSSHSGPSTSLASSSHSGPSTSLASSSYSGPSPSQQYLSHSRRAAQRFTHPTMASSSSHSGSSTSMASSSSPEGHITPGGPGGNIGQGVQQGGSAAGGQALMQRLGRCVKAVKITGQGLNEARLSSANLQALAVLFPNAEIVFANRR